MTVPAQSLGFLHLTYNASANITSRQLRSATPKIQSDYMYLQYKEKDQSDGSAVFLLQKRDQMASFTFDFGLRYYPAYQGYHG